MAKVFYVAENAPDYSQVNFYKTEKEALEYGLSQIPNFEMGEEPMNDEENDGEEWFMGAELTFKKGILYTVEDGEVIVEAMDEDDAKEYAQQLDTSAVTMFFDGFKKGMYGYQGRDADGKDYKWAWDGYEFTDARGNVEVKQETWVVYQLDNNDVKMHYGSYDSKEGAEKAIEISVKGVKFGGKVSSTPREKLGMMLFDEFKEATKKGEASWTYTAESNKINIKHTMKHIKLFEQFSKSLNEGISSSDKKKLEEFAAQVSEEIIDANNHNRKFDEDEYSEEAMYNIFLDMVADYDSVDEFIDEYDWRGFTMELGL
jgi:hypothetical protein